MPTRQNRIEYGLSMLAYALATISDAGAVTYATPVMIPGARSISLSPQGDLQELYADNVPYITAHGNSGYDGSGEVVRIPDEFSRDCLGEKSDAAQGSNVKYETAEPNVAQFALLGQFDGDYKNKRFVLYNCSASRPDFKGQTTENGGPDFGNATQSFNLRATGRPGDKLVRASLVDDGSETFSNWFNTVYVPTLSAQGG